MIKFKNWTITSNGLLAQQYDNLSRRIEIVGDLPDGWDWDVLLQVNDAMDIIALSPMEGGVGHTLTAEQVSVSGCYTVQLRGRQGNIVKHTNTTQCFVPKSLSGNAQWPTIPSEFTDLEQRLREINDHPPVPGEDGFWRIWNPQTNAYEPSNFPLPEGTSSGGGSRAVLYTPQVLAEEQQLQARKNINAAPEVLVVEVREFSGDDFEDVYVTHTASQIIEHAQRGGMVVLHIPEMLGFIMLPIAMGYDDYGVEGIDGPYAAFYVMFGSGALYAVLSDDPLDFVFESVSLEGPQGEQGPMGPEGPAGADGATPEKGVDYWTDEDKQSIVNDVLAALPVWEGGSY